jgi:hypothetical protein
VRDHDDVVIADGDALRVRCAGDQGCEIVAGGDLGNPL